MRGNISTPQYPQLVFFPLGVILPNETTSTQSWFLKFEIQQQHYCLSSKTQVFITVGVSLIRGFQTLGLSWFKTDFKFILPFSHTHLGSQPSITTLSFPVNIFFARR